MFPRSQVEMQNKGCSPAISLRVTRAQARRQEEAGPFFILPQKDATSFSVRYCESAQQANAIYGYCSGGVSDAELPAEAPEQQ